MASRPLKTTQILLWAYKERPEGFTVKDVVQEFDIPSGEAQRRVVAILWHLWGAIRPAGHLITHKRGRRQVLYALTDWGTRYSKRSPRARKKSGPKSKGE